MNCNNISLNEENIPKLQASKGEGKMCVCNVYLVLI